MQNYGGCLCSDIGSLYVSTSWPACVVRALQFFQTDLERLKLRFIKNPSQNEPLKWNPNFNSVDRAYYAVFFKEPLSKWTPGTVPCCLRHRIARVPENLKRIVSWVQRNDFRWNWAHKTCDKNIPWRWKIKLKTVRPTKTKLNEPNPVEIGPIEHEKRMCC